MKSTISSRSQRGRTPRFAVGAAQLAAILLGLACAMAPRPARADLIYFETFNMDAFVNGIRNRLNGKVTGYAYAIYQYDTLLRSGSSGLAVVSSATPMTSQKRVTMLSMSKTITAAALMKAIEIRRAQGSTVSINSRIRRFLPKSWTLGPGVKQLTFRDLLRHESGLNAVQMGPDTDPDVYANLKQTIANGRVLPAPQWPGQYYRNCNFTLMRILIPYLLKGRAFFKTFEPLGQVDEVTGAMYVDFVKKNILNPIGIDTNVIPTGPTPYTKYYNFLTGAFLPPQPPDAFRRTGAGYWYMSVREYGQFIAALRNGQILEQESWQTMRDNWLGLYHSNWPHGEYIDHNGGYTINGAGSAGDWMGFPDGITAVIYYNSQSGLATPPQDIIRQSYEAAWQ